MEASTLPIARRKHVRTGTKPTLWERTLAAWAILKRTTLSFISNDPFGQAGAIAFSTILALPAVLILTLVSASLFWNPEEVRDALYSQAGSLIGMEAAMDLRDIVEKARSEAQTVFAQVVGIGTLLFSATSVFISVQGALNRIWEVKPVPGRAIVKYFISRLLSLALIACFGFLLLVSLVLDTGLVAFGERLQLLFPDLSVTMLAVLNIALSLLVIATVFGLTFKLLPDVRVHWRDVRSGAILTAVLFSLGKYLIGFYVGTSSVDDAYGAAGTVIVILLWVFFSAVILLFGAQFTHEVARSSGRKVETSEHAVAEPKAAASPRTAYATRRQLRAAGARPREQRRRRGC